jgi:hypothetical protein
MEKPDTHQSAIIPRRPEQLTLFPDEEDSLLYDSSEAYRRLSPVEQAIVRACLVEIYVECRWPTQTKVAAAAGVSRTTVQKYLADPASKVHMAITQISAAHGGQMCKRCRDIIPQIALMILHQVKGGRSTASITPTEFNMLKLATEMGGVPMAMTNGAPPVNVNIAADGSRLGVQITAGETDALSAYLSKLSSSQRMQSAPVLTEEPGQCATPVGPEVSDGFRPAGEATIGPPPAPPFDAVGETAVGTPPLRGEEAPKTAPAVESG